MEIKKKDDKLITDAGIIENNQSKQAHRFVFLCDIISIALVILGIITFVKGNF